nr:MAG TPA: hypothetical protein [Caudoviricetes sp.]
MSLMCPTNMSNSFIYRTCFLIIIGTTPTASSRNLTI